MSWVRVPRTSDFRFFPGKAKYGNNVFASAGDVNGYDILLLSTTVVRGEGRERSPALLAFCMEARERFRGSFHRFHGSFHGRYGSYGSFHGSCHGSNGSRESFHGSFHSFHESFLGSFRGSVRGSFHGRYGR